MHLFRHSSVRETFRTIQILTLLLLVFLVVQGVALWRVCDRGSRATRALVMEGLPSLRLLAVLEKNLTLYRLHSFELMFVQEGERKAKAAAADALDRQNRELLVQIKLLFPAGEGRQLVLALENGLTNYVQTMVRLRVKVDADFNGAMQVLDQDVPPLVQRLDAVATQLKNFCDAYASTRATTTVEQFAGIRTAVVGWGSASIGFAALATILVTVSSARLRSRVSALVTRMSECSALVSDSGRVVASTSQSLADRSGQQAASLEETSASLEEMSSMTRRNAESASQAKNLASQSRLSADAGVTGMHHMSQSVNHIQSSSLEMRQAMDAVKASNDEVSKIIKTIDEIAFQTNILALNAAVEAARAGAAGMGFAVVAEEVRNLAQKSAQAARETAAKIEGAIRQTGVAMGVSEKVVDNLKNVLARSTHVEESLVAIASNAREVDGLVAQIAAASAEQNQGIEQIALAVNAIDKVTQANAASAEQSARAADELNTQATVLTAVVGDLVQLADRRQKKQTPPRPAREHMSDTASAPASQQPSKTPAAVNQAGTRKPSNGSVRPFTVIQTHHHPSEDETKPSMTDF